MVIVIHCLLPSAQTNEMEPWIQLLTRDNSDSLPLSVYWSNELWSLSSTVSMPHICGQVSKEPRLKEINAASQ